jgi:hypothetical protein
MTNQTARLTVAEFLNHRVQGSGKRPSDIAAELGFGNDRVIVSILNGNTQLPINKIIPFARAIDAEPGHLLHLVLNEYMPGLHGVIEECLGMELLTKREAEIIKAYRDLPNNEGSLTLTVSPESVFATPQTGANGQ